MHPSNIAKRAADAQNRIMDAAGAISKRWGIPSPTRGAGRYNDVNSMLTWESVATFLEALATASPGVKIEEVLAVPGLSGAAIKAIQKHYEVEPADGEPTDK